MTDVDAIRAAMCLGADDADELLDGLYPPEFRRFRRQHTTPVEVAARAAAWLAPTPDARVLDVGSGAGRFCVTGALTTLGHFTGVEQRGWLVEAAREAASKLGVTRAEFVNGDIRSLDWTAFEGFYLFNPFGENYLPDDEQIDHAEVRARDRMDADISFVEQQLVRAPFGTRVVTWHGFGGVLEGYSCVRRTYVRNTVLECLVRV